jgi:hypothetical protein
MAAVTDTHPAAAERPAPPATVLGMISIGLVASGVIYLAAYLPRHAPLGPAVGLLIAAAAVLAASLVLLARQTEFAWWRFFQVAWWTLLAYIVIAGMIEFAFVYDHTRGKVLVVMTLLLLTFMLNVPVILGFTVARFAEARRPE